MKARKGARPVPGPTMRMGRCRSAGRRKSGFLLMYTNTRWPTAMRSETYVEHTPMRSEPRLSYLTSAMVAYGKVGGEGEGREWGAVECRLRGEERGKVKGKALRSPVRTGKEDALVGEEEP